MGPFNGVNQVPESPASVQTRQGAAIFVACPRESATGFTPFPFPFPFPFPEHLLSGSTRDGVRLTKDDPTSAVV